MPDLLIELFSEEIPARMQSKAAEDLKKLVTDGLVEAGLTYASAGAFSTPRRLTLSVEGLLAQSAPVREERKGPRADAPPKAIEGFLRSVGLTRDQVKSRETPKGRALFAVLEKPGRPAGDIVGDVLGAAIRNFPWPKSMRWGTGPLRWVRPLHSILCLLTDEEGARVVPLDVDGIVSGDTTQGHRFMAPGRFSVSGFDDYSTKLKRANVILNASERAQAIWNDATNLAFAQGLEVVEDRGLLTEVAGLVEWPVVLMGDIDPEFLDLPPEVLRTSMKEHQKFFSVKDKTGKIVKFITVANRETSDQGATILAGNQKVLSARLADAKFFWENDLRVAQSDMSVWTQSLANVTFHNKLGSQSERIDRIAKLARDLSEAVGADIHQAEEAAQLAKADLSSEMVYEFPELQGLMGRYYIAASGKSAELAAVAQEHYSPLGPSDSVPSAPLSVAVALADKLDTLTGFWAIDEKPTGSKDPFALRRAALGVIRLILENAISLPLERTFGPHLVTHMTREELEDLDPGPIVNVMLEMHALGFKHSAKSLAQQAMEDFAPEKRAAVSEILGTYPALAQDLLGFILDRLKVYLRDTGIRHDIIDACTALQSSDDLLKLVNRTRALNDVIATEDGVNLIQGFKRANNIVKQAEEKDGVEYSYGADPVWAETDEERALFTALDAAEAKIKASLLADDYAEAMQAMAALRAPIDVFFTAVKINSENQTVRRNRLNLLNRIRATCLEVADLSKIDG